MPKHYMTKDEEPEKKIPSVLEIMEKYETMREGMDMMGGPAIGPDMAPAAGQMMPPPAIAPPIVPAGGVPGAHGDAALSPPPEIADTEPKEKKEEKPSGKGMKVALKGIREALMDIEIKLRELGALEDEEEGEEEGPAPGENNSEVSPY